MSEQSVDMVIILSMQAIMFILMRIFYGAWPWEYEKTWRALKPRPRVIKPPPKHMPIPDDPHDSISSVQNIPGVQISSDQWAYVPSSPWPHVDTSGDTFVRVVENDSPKSNA